MSETETAHKAWNETWKSADGRAIWSEPEDEVRELTATLRDRGAETALDLGCGVGRHAAYLASQGFSTWALDGSETGIEHARGLTGEAGLDVTFDVGLMTGLPYEDVMFDYILSFNVIYHGDKETVIKAVSEIRRTLKPGGIYQGTMLSKRNGYFGKGKEISTDTFIYDDDGSGDEAHPHFYCNAGELVNLFEGFELISLHDLDHSHRRPKHWHWHLVAERLP
ncbi:MAG: class I SAM-dependent methyltransferase [Rhodospirillales bacterium]|nr:class I SAM-dependent methyltransferase [Alphaproteobacteria bacterium]MBL6948903.1 class I SAM-dependent methyltransferase [Rhodospirillales bacterium]